MKTVVIGAGYAGPVAANRLAGKAPTAEITVLDPRPEFVERVRLHRHVAGSGAVTESLTTMLRTGIASIVGTVDRIDDGRVRLDDGRTLGYDHVVLAVGSTAGPMPVGTWEGAERSRVALATLTTGSTVTVIGGGPTGIETASEVAFTRPDVRVRLIGPAVASSFSQRAHRRIRASLKRLTVDLVDDEVTSVERDSGEFRGVVRLRSGSMFASDLTLWAIIGEVPDLAARSGLAVDHRGRVVVDEFLRSVTDHRILAVVDCAAVPGARMACRVAGPPGAHAADTRARTIGGRDLVPYSVRHLARAVSLGRRDAVGQFTRRDDTLLPASRRWCGSRGDGAGDRGCEARRTHGNGRMIAPRGRRGDAGASEPGGRRTRGAHRGRASAAARAGREHRTGRVVHGDGRGDGAPAVDRRGRPPASRARDAHAAAGAVRLEGAA
ncbi:NADH dehydrogenase FAD-containing subunit [Actinoalloteichus hoggarensis]|uniref:Rhodocoxin reductase n=1 Tax=Actinoalloteichus hoggarensis TaxID=1470176 RepID=A0A221W076_9PSEU|nr:FAD-dependent oxidoreductase [Actinoalloteichus hoggarensis]ASO18981.1 Rhodocoxin reductase [Actinoalloteichus hoggarensis]MBB5920217.1 NADH dehydrogenase FAD-containing subunit [Actinoalloteichus hoggarensis]